MWSHWGQARRWACTNSASTVYLLTSHYSWWDTQPATFSLRTVLDVELTRLTCIGVFLMASTTTSFHPLFHQRTGVAPKSHHNFPSVHDLSLALWPGASGVFQMSAGDCPSCLLCSPRRQQPLLRKANKKPPSTTAWDTDSYFSGRIKTRPQTHRNPGITWSRSSAYLPLIRSPGVSGWTGLVKTRNKWLTRT